jgi:hypothetical protein
LPFPFSICSKQTEVCCFRFPFAPTNGSINKYIYIYIVLVFCAYICCLFKPKTEAQVIFLNLFAVFWSCKQMFIICLFVEEEKTKVIHLQVD